MKIKITPSTIEGHVVAPPSKSYTHRALVCSALAKGENKIISPLKSDDTDSTMDLLEKLGVTIRVKEDSWEITGGQLHQPEGDLFCRESGTTMRFMTAICSLVNGTCRLTGGSSLSKRPMKPLIDGLKQLGVECTSENGFPPVTVKGGLTGGQTKIPGDISSQFISALLLVAPLAKENTDLILTTPLESKPYVLMTMDTQRKFGIEIEASEDLREFWIKKQAYKPRNYKVEGDWSSTAFLLASGALTGEIETKNLNANSLQADREILNVLKKMGAQIISKSGNITLKKAELEALEFDVSDCPDLFPILTVLCAVAKGKSKLTGIKRLRIKESDRIAAMKEGFTRMNVAVMEEENSVIIKQSKPTGAIIDPKNDHRIAMAFAVLSLVAEGETIIQDAECVSKSFPNFWDVMKHLGMNFEEII
ncbi:MAG: 3-phosphoshikimate 1-carboxyvinyltransferase [Promethearchaeota archaeon]